jgi:hypothetical protein
MIDPTRIDYTRVARVARDGSPLFLQALGRLCGLGPSERAAFGAEGDGVPAWAVGALALGIGIVVGARIQKAWPDKLPAVITG